MGCSPTVARYLDIMVDLLLVRRLQPWASNGGKRLVRSPKVYVRDSGLLHTLLGIQDQETLLGHPVIGSRWEGMIIENILDTVPTNTRAWFYRTSVGAEIDLVLETAPNQRWAIEIKRSISDPTPSKGFYIGCADVKANHQIVIYQARRAISTTQRRRSCSWARYSNGCHSRQPTEPHFESLLVPSLCGRKLFTNVTRYDNSLEEVNANC